MTYNLCIIPARGGSKRIPRKNIRAFCGKPMIAWSIDVAQRSGCFDQILVSSDDPDILEIASSYGASVPFIRPPNLSDDYIGTTAVVSHAVQWCVDNIQTPDYVCCLYATSPFTRSSDLRNGLLAARQLSDDRFVFTATTFASTIYRAFTINTQSGIADMLYPENYMKRSQDLEECYHDAGQFYWARPSAWLTESNIFEGGYPLVIPRWRVQDIDSEDDWIRAELLHQLLLSSTSSDE